jgi:hypothetical protein
MVYGVGMVSSHTQQLTKYALQYEYHNTQVACPPYIPGQHCKRPSELANHHG